MPINLLPQGLRGKEKKEFNKNKEVAKDIKLNRPTGNFKKKQEIKQEKGTFLSFFEPLFFSKEKKIKKRSLTSAEKNKKPEEEKRREIKSLLKNKKKIKKEENVPVKVVYRPFSENNSILNKPSGNGIEGKQKNNKTSDLNKKSFLKLNQFLKNNNKEEKEKKEKEVIPAKTIKEKSSPVVSSLKAKEDKYKPKNKKTKTKKSNSDNINFVLEEYSGALKVKVFKKTIFLLIVVIVFLSMAFSLQLFLDYRKNELEKKREALIVENKKMGEKINNDLEYKYEAEEINLKLSRIEHLLKNHIYWSDLFEFLEKNTLKTVYYTNFENGGVKQLNLKAVTVSFEELSRQLDIFQVSPNIESVKIDSGTMVKAKDGVQEVKFDIVLKFKDDFFFR